MRKDVLVIGGGIGGLTAGALLANDGFKVTVLEASNEWGGCAGKFERKPYLFPVGATLGMGFEEGGIHNKILNKLQLHSKVYPLETIMKIKSNRPTIHYFRDRNAFIKEMESHFTKHKKEVKSFFYEVWKVGASVRALYDKLPILPPMVAREWTNLIGLTSVKSIRLLSYINRTMKDLLKKHNLDQVPSFVKFIDGVIIDSMQTNSSNCSAIMGCLALDIYHVGAFYVEGGLYKVAESLQQSILQNGGQTLLRKKAVAICKRDSLWIVTDQKGNVYEAQHVVCNLTVTSLITILEEDLVRKLPHAYHKKSKNMQWGAFTLYAAIKEEHVKDKDTLFYQVIASDNHAMTEGNHIFVSISHKDDRYRAPEGYRTLTVSTHTNIDDWQGKLQYEQKKQKLENMMIHSLSTIFSDLDSSSPEKLISGGPRAWERFTQRPHGAVGGFPQTKDNSLFNSLSHRTSLKGLWLCGDNVFPGAGTIGVSISGYHCYKSIIDEKDS
ncbi:FAD-binding protein [Bacillus sp. HMF5848]|uniref:FAD-dependent oxidoreductase n=1 Tax=Bacillus sp. HMF5848 TaxID=2495421 RepID=UPI000F78205A|nr:FAD-dependent oxidoreductase [Bacillus sp. HMF5848]RSK27301.1 FAD-binding protein [Bacillus sp. HMF5848]